MAYIVSARKYRPKTFDEVVGQQAVTNILKKAVETNRLAQALLFTGPRGVGKTSCARIMAREVNKDYLDDPSQDLSFNIFELDAASHNSVDDIRDLIEQVRIPPQVGKYKVYIIDEVHMLSTQAFNAFLKTLEEPPEHAIFILATTEKHKIPPTILSRCQIFDFKRISVTDIKDHLKKIAALEGIDADEDALYLIARHADGALRDALSAFDKIISLGGKKITRQMVADHLGILDFDVYFDITDLLSRGNAPALLEKFDQLVTAGSDIYRFIGGLTSHFRDLLMARHPSTLQIMEQSDEIKERYRRQSEYFDEDKLTRAIDLLVKADLDYKLSQHPRFLTELTLLKILSLFQGSKKKNNAYDISLPEPSPDSNPFTGGAVQKEQTNNLKKGEEKEEEKTDIAPVSAQKEPPRVREKTSDFNTLGLGALRRQKTDTALREDDFTEDDLKKYWIEFADLMRQKGENELVNAMQAVFPVITNHVLRLEFANPFHFQQFKKYQSQLLDFLRHKLHNHKIVFDISLNPGEAPATKEELYYTREQKIKRLTELNPYIKDLIDKLHLE